ncbi:MAG: hypothetical protein IKK82_09280 [Kiritimatiellae bacterium]|nr:hypothetical protein [Kiritimatiellia bacterium]
MHLHDSHSSCRLRTHICSTNPAHRLLNETHCQKTCI